MRELELRLKIVLLIGLITSCSCNSAKNLVGVYRSNFAQNGFFIAKITLKPDSVFGYRMRGDVLNDTAKGKYKVAHKKLMMKYDKPILEVGGYLKTGLNDSTLFQAEIVGDRGPRIYRLGHRKLFMVDSLGHKAAKAIGYSKHKRFLIWGNYYLLNRRYYLKKIK